MFTQCTQFLLMLQSLSICPWTKGSIEKLPESVDRDSVDARSLDAEGAVLERSVERVGEGDGQSQGLTDLRLINSLWRQGLG